MYRVLIVDDELPALRFIQSIIEKFAADYQILGTCTSGEQALDFLNSHAVDLLITDISMHGMSGIELARFAREPRAPSRPAWTTISSSRSASPR